MKSISNIVNKIRNLLPYFLLIAFYFFYVSHEARKENIFNINSENDNRMTNDAPSNDEQIIRIRIPVLPYNE